MAINGSSVEQCLALINELDDAVENARKTLINAEACVINRKYLQDHLEMLKGLLPDALEQAESIIQDKPTHKFVRKFHALLESGKVCVLDKNRPCDFIPQSCVGYEDDEFFYLHSEVIHKEVRKLCDEQGESFTISQKSLLKALAEEGFSLRDGSKNTKKLDLGDTSPRMIWLRKDRAQAIVDEVC